MYLGEIASLLTALFFSIGAFLFASATLRIGSATVNLSRLMISAMLFFLTILFFQIPVHVSLYQAAMLAVSGVIGLVAGDTFFFKSLEYLSARISTLVASFAPAVAGVLAYFFLGESLSPLNIFGIAVTLAGICLVVFRSEENAGRARAWKDLRKGLLFAFLYCFGQAAGVILVKLAYREGDVNSIVATLIRVVPAIIVLIPLLMIMKEYRNPVTVFRNDAAGFKLMFIAAFIGTYLGLVGMFIAITHSDVAIASTLIATMPVIQLPIARYWYKETISWRAITGAFITVGGVALLFIR
jgi:drug/metabolite transporter (DMT)-like permease